jgi:hypothetical protein
MYKELLKGRFIDNEEVCMEWPEGYEKCSTRISGHSAEKLI